MATRKQPLDARKSYGQFFDCGCGMKVSDTVRARSQHKNCTWHRQYKRITRLLSRPCVNFAEIGRRTGITRERVRQIYTDILKQGTGRERAIVCAINHNEELASQAKSIVAPEVKTFWGLAESRGFTCSPVPAKTSSKYRCKYQRHALTVNGRLIVARSLLQSGRYFLMHRPINSLAELAVHQLPDGRWMIVPHEKWPRTRTSFALTYTQHGAARAVQTSFRHDWRDYIDAWHLLAPKTESQAA